MKFLLMVIGAILVIYGVIVAKQPRSNKPLMFMNNPERLGLLIATGVAILLLGFVLL